jgi:hypothetical protein
MEDLKALQDYLTVSHPGCLLMPTKETGKLPLWPHKDDQYKIEDVYSKGLNHMQEGCLILFSANLIVIDIDDKDYSETFENCSPDFAKTVCTETRKGYHYYFTRTERCNEVNMFDGARQLFINEDTPFPIDIKTICKTGTKGCIAIPPSPNKTWVRKLGEYTPLPMPDTFINFYIAKQKKHVTNTINTINIVDYFDTSYIDQIMNCLKSYRANNYTQWISVGWCLHNISETLLSTWIKFSKSSTKYFDGECEKLWPLMRNTGYGIGSLKLWAKEDNPELYKQIIFKDDKKRKYSTIVKSQNIEKSVLSFIKVITFIMKDVLNIKDFNIEATRTDKITYEIVSFNFGFINLHDYLCFKKIVKYFCKYESSHIKQHFKYIYNSVEELMYFSLSTSDDLELCLMNTEHKLESICDRYLIKTVKDVLKLSTFYKYKIKNDLYRDVLENITYFEEITPIYEVNNCIKYLLSCIPSPQNIEIWKLVGKILFNTNSIISLWKQWDLTRSDLADEHWKQFKSNDKYNEDLLLFISELYIKDCKISFEHLKMVHQLYLDKTINTTFEGIIEEYNIDVIDPIQGRCKPFDIINKDLYVSISPMGSGKSYRCIEAVKPLLNYYDTVLVPTSRQTYADNITARYIADLDTKFLCYKDVSLQELRDADMLVVQMESILKANKELFEMILGDEILSLLSQLSSDTIKKRFEECLARFLHYICNAKKIILCDAFSSNQLLNFIRFIQMNHIDKDFRIQMSLNRAKIIQRRAYKVGIITGKNKERILNNFMYEIFKKIDANKKIVIVSGSKKELDNIMYMIHQKYPNKILKSYTSDMDDIACREELRECEKHWIIPDVLGWTSKILIGVNFSIPDIFDSIFVIGDNNTCLVRDIHQSMMRVRHLISDEIYYIVNEKDCIEKQDRIAKDLEFFISQAVFNLSRVSYNRHMTQYKEFITYLLGYNDYEKYITRRCYTKEFERLLLEQNYEILDISDANKKNIDISFIPLNDNTENEYDNLSKFISLNEDKIPYIEEKVKTYKATLEDKKILKVYYFNRLFRNILGNEQEKIQEWESLFNVYDSRYGKYLKQMQLECRARQGDIETMINDSNKNLFTSIDINKVRYIINICDSLGIQHSLNFKVFTEDDLNKLYNALKNEWNDIIKTFSIRSTVKSDNKPKLMCSYLNSIWMEWCGLNFKANIIGRKSINNNRIYIYEYNIMKPNQETSIYDTIIKNDLLLNYLKICYTPQEIVYSINDELEL